MKGADCVALFNRKENTVVKTIDGDFNYLSESAYDNMMSSVKGIPLYNFINAIKGVNNSEFYYGNTYDRMMDDAIISSALDLYVDDSTQIDTNKKRMAWVELDLPDDAEEDELSKGLVDELNNFLDEIKLEKNLPQIARRILVHGDAPVKVSFVDTLEDDRLKVTKLNESDNISSSIDAAIVNNTTDEELESKLDLSDKPVRLDEIAKSMKDNRRILNRFNKKYLKESLVEGSTTLSYKKVLPGRWYIEMLGNGSNLCALESKGKVLALIDREDNNNVITKDNIALFMNPKATRVTLEVGSPLESADKREYYTISKGDSFLKNARVAWQVLSALEDILLLTRMTRSILYRIFSVEVANKGNKETMQILNSLKNKIKMDETINVKEKIYNSTLAQVPLGDSIFIPTRNGVGAIKVDTIGGDFNLRDAIDLDYFKDKLFAALKIPRSFLGFEDDMPGSLGNTSLVRMDIRYARSVRGLQNILCDGIKDIIDIYLKYTRSEKVLNELPNIRICMTSINTSEDVERVETEKVRMETVDKIVETLNNLGIDMEKYIGVRNEIINEWFGSNIMDKIKEDENKVGNEPVVPEDSEDDEGIDFHSTPSDVSFEGGDDSNDELLGGEPDEGPEPTDNEGPVEPEEDSSNEPPQDIPYSLH